MYDIDSQKLDRQDSNHSSVTYNYNFRQLI